MDLNLLALFAAARLVSSGTPGPSIAALVARVLTKGLGSVVPFLVAMWIGEALWLIAAVLGLGFIAQTFGTALHVIKFLGVAYLLYLAWRMWNAPVGPEADAIPDRDSPVLLFLSGLAVTLGNPKIMVFYLALLPSIFDLSAIAALGLMELVVVAVAVLMIVDLGWAFAAAWARGWLTSPRARRAANRTGAVAMAGAATAIAVQ
jgi:threonine/homoserine/homoserine lactone efflux protein